MKIHGHASGSVLELAAILADSPVELRWGGPQVPRPEVINGSVALLDGLQQLEAFADASVACPQFTTNLNVTASWPQGSILLARNLQHSQGKDIVAVVGTAEGVQYRSFRPGARLQRIAVARFKQADYWTCYTPSVREWRFHILRRGDQYTSIARALKVWAGPGPEPVQAPLVRSRRLGWHMSHSVAPPKGLRELAKAAVRACGYDLGAVDLLELPSGEGIVLEVNSRPALRDPYTLEKYSTALRGWKGNQ